MICAISKESEYLIAEYIQQLIKANDKYDLEQIINNVYETMKAKTDEESALAYAGLVPALTLKLFGYNAQLRKQFKPDLNALQDRIDEFSDFEKVKARFAKAPVKEIKKTPPVAEPEKDITIENLNTALVEAKGKTVENNRTVMASRPSYWATRGSDKRQPEGAEDPEAAHFKVLRYILTKIDPNTKTVNLPGIGPVYLKAVQLFAFAANEKVKSNLDVQIVDGKVVVKNADVKSTWTPSENDIIYTLVDQKGDYLYFDQNGQLSNKENGFVPYYSVLSQKSYRDKLSSIKKFRSQLKYAKRYEDLTDIQKNDIDKAVKGEMSLLTAVEKYAIDNPGEGLLFSIWGGSEGYSPQIKLAEFDFKDKAFNPDVDPARPNSNPYFFVNGVKYEFVPDRGLREQDVETILSLLFDKLYDPNTNKPITAKKRNEEISKFFYAGKVDKDPKLVVNIQNFSVRMNDDGTIDAVFAKYDEKKDTYDSKMKQPVDITGLDYRNIIKRILSNNTYYHVNTVWKKQSSNFTLPVVSDNMLEQQKTDGYSEWIRSNDKFQIIDKVKEEPYLLFEPIRSTYEYFLSKGESAKIKQTPQFQVQTNEKGIVYGNMDTLREMHNEGKALYTMRVSKAQATSKNFGFKGLDQDHHFGNPFTGTDVKDQIPMQDIPAATAAYEAWLDGQNVFTDKNGVEHDLSDISGRRDWINKEIKRLREKGGVPLGYFKKGYRSHADVLAERINVGQPAAQPSTGVKPTDYTNHSGGAYGGDTFWDVIGREFGVTNHKHYREEGNKSLSKQLRDKGVQATVLTKEQMDQARAEVKRLLGKEYPDTTEGNLQVRNYYQVANSDAVFAIAQLADENGKAIKSYLYPTIKGVTGGTNTAVQLGIKLNKPVYVWDLGLKTWFKWNGVHFEPTNTPTLTKNFAGVGSRDIESYSVKNKETGKWEQRKQYKGKEIEDAAKQAIREVYENTFGKPGAQPAAPAAPAGITERDQAPPTVTNTNSQPGIQDKKPIDKASKDEWNKVAPLKTAEVPATKEQLDQALAWYKDSIFAKAGIPFEVMFNIANSNAVATFSKAGIRLYAGSDYSDLYHESWHAFTRMFLNEKQRTDLWNEIRKYEGSFTDYNGVKVEFAKATDDQIEEYLAEDFRAYMLSKGTKINKPTPVKQSIFKKIFNALKTIFGNLMQYLGIKGRQKAADIANNPLAFKNIKDLYENIRIGSLPGLTFQENVRDFGTINKSIRYLNQTDDQNNKMRHEDTMLVFETIESFLSQLVDNVNQASGNSRRTVTMYTDEQNRNKAYRYVKEHFEDVILPRLVEQRDAAKSDTEKAQIQYYIDLANTVINNFGNVDDIKENSKLEAGVVYFHMMHSKIISEEAKQEFFDTEVDRKEQNMFQDKGPNETALEELAGEDVIRMIRGLYAYDDNGKIQTNVFGEPKLMDFKKAFSIISKNLLGIIDRDKMYAKMQELSATKPMFNQLLTKLGPIDSPEDVSQKLWVNFWQAFNKSRVKIMQHTFVQNVNKETGDTSYQLNVGYASGEGKKVQSNWARAFQNGDRTFIKRKKDFKGDRRNYLDIAAVMNVFEIDDVANDPIKAFNFLKAIGIKMTDLPEIKNHLVTIPLYRQAVQNIHNQLKLLSQNDITVDSFEGIFEDYKGITGIQGRLNALSDLEASEGTSVSNYMASSATDDTVYEISLNNTMLATVYYVNDSASESEMVNKPQLNHLSKSRNPFTKTSIWGRSFFEKNGRRRQIDGVPVTIMVDNVSGAKVVDQYGNSEGVATMNSSPFERFVMEFHSIIMRGSPELSRHGDKKTASAAYVRHVQSYDAKKVQDFKFIDDVDFSLTEGMMAAADPYSRESAGANRFFDIMLGYIYSEMARIREMREMPEDAIFDKGYKERGSEFVIFDRMLSADAKKALIDIAVSNVKSEDGALNKFQTFIESQQGSDVMQAFKGYMISEHTDVFVDMKRSVNEWLVSEAQRNEKLYMPAEMKFIDPKVFSTFDSVLRKKTAGSINVSDVKYEQRQQALMMSYTANRWINGYETAVWIYGDPAQFDIGKGMWQKRIPGAASTGDLAATDQAMIDRLKTMGRPYTQRTLEGTDYVPYEIGSDGVINTVVLEDSLVDLPNLPKIEKALNKYFKRLYPSKAEELTKRAVKGYKKQEEGNAQAWISFDGYRSLRYSQGKWTPEHEDLYQRILNGENIDSEKIEKFFNVVKWQYQGAIALPGLPMMAQHKYSIFPLIPNVIKDRTLNDLHYQMMRQGVDIVMLQTASKISTLSKNGKLESFYSDNPSRIFNQEIEFVKTPIFMHYLKDQQETGDEYKNKVTFPTQQRVLVTDDLFENGVPLDFEPGMAEEKRITEWAKHEKKWNTYTEKKKQQVSPMYGDFIDYKDRVDAYTKALEVKLLRKIGWSYDKSGKPTGNTKKLMEYVVKQLNAQDVPSHLLDIIGINEKGELKQDLSITPNANQIQGLLHALVNKEIIRQKTRGESLIQVSRMGWEKPTQEQYDMYKGGDLPFYDYDKEGDLTKPMRVKISLQGDFIKLLDHPEVIRLSKASNIDRLRALNLLLKNEKWLNDNQEFRDMITMVAARIPVQGMNSMDFMQVAEFLPNNAGHIIIMPESIVGKSGSDFDIDKMFTLMPSIVSARGMVGFVSSKEVMSIEESDKLDKEYDKKEEKRNSIYQSYKEKLDKLKAGDLEGFENELETVIAETERRYGKRMNDLENKIDKFKKLAEKIRKGQMSEETSVGVHDELYDAYAEREMLQNEMDEKIYKYAKSSAIKSLIEERNKKLEPLDKELFEIRKKIQAGSTQGISNGLIQSMKRLMERPENFVNLVRPNDTDILDPIVEKMDKYANRNYDPTYGTGKISGTTIFTTPFDIYIQQTSSVAKRALGIVAVGNVSKVRLNQVGLHLPETNDPEISTIEEFKQLREEFEDLVRTEKKTSMQFKEMKALEKMLKKFLPQRVLLPHNSVVVNGEKMISLAGRFNSEKTERTADVHNQLINAAVDVVKHPKNIFNLQGNLELISVLELLVDSGVDLETAVMFLTQPLIQEYAQAERVRKGPLASVFNVAPRSKSMFRYDAKLEVVAKYGIARIQPSEEYGQVWIDKLDILFKTMDRTERNKDAFTKEFLEKRLKSYYDQGDTTITLKDEAIFLHFLELQQMAKAVTSYKLTMNPDKSRAKNLFQVMERQFKIEAIRQDGRLPQSVIDREYESGLLSSFYKAMDFQEDVFQGYFKIDNNPELMDEIRESLRKDDEGDSLVLTKTGYTAEDAMVKMVNDFKVYLFQKELYDFDLKTIDSYKGYGASQEFKVVPKRFIPTGVYFEGDIVYVDKKKLERDYASLGQTEKQLGLAPISKSNFEQAKNYYQFVFEREHQRHVTPLTEDLKNSIMFQEIMRRVDKANQSLSREEKEKIAYEEFLRDTAFKNIYNIPHMFQSQNAAMADVLEMIIQRYPELALESGYSVLSVLDRSTSKAGVKNIRLYGGTPTGDMQTTYQEQLMDLMDPEKIKRKTGDTISDIDRRQIADFFSKLPIFSMLQNGYDIDKALSLQSIMPQQQISEIMVAVTEPYTRKKNPQKFDSNMLIEFVDKFIEQNKLTNAKRDNFKNYDTPPQSNAAIQAARESVENITFLSETAEDKGLVFETDINGNLMFRVVGFDTKDPENVENALNKVKEYLDKPENRNKVLVFNDVFNPNSKLDFNKTATSNDWILRRLASDDAYKDRVVGIPTRAAYSANYGNDKISDVDGKMDPNWAKALDVSLEYLEDLAADEGKTLVFNKNGYGQILIGHSDSTAEAPEKNVLSPAIQGFDTLSKELFRRFGYENPNFIKRGVGPIQFVESVQKAEIERVTQKVMPTHDEIMNKIKSCSK